MTLAERYYSGLKAAYAAAGEEAIAEWNEFEEAAWGISELDREALLKVWPEVPASLLGLLEKADGTYWRKYGNKDIAFYFLASDVDDGQYPYYLYSARQLIEDARQKYHNNFADLFYYFHEENGEDEFGLFVDERIRSDDSEVRWLCFSDCMNNGGTSSLFIDFTPSDKGVKGQIIRFLHDPDELRVIADSFDEYLEDIIKQGFAFVEPEYL